MSEEMGYRSEEDFMNTLSTVRKDIIEDCMTALGYPVISLFITQEQINRFIDFSVRKCTPKVNTTFLRSAYIGSGAINISEWGVEAVKNVYSGDIAASGGSDNLVAGECGDCNPGSSLSGCDICQKLCQYRGYSYGMLKGSYNNEMYDLIAYQGALSELKKQILDDAYYDQSSGMLYLDNYSGMVTIEYVKSHPTLEDISNDSKWYSWVRDYTLALSKITEGRIRGKYKPQSGVFEIEADELVSEGNTDKQELEEELKDDIGYWNILR